MNAPFPISLETPQRILVVDDEGIVLVALREILLREGYQVMTHSNPLQALEALKKEPFSVILTDQQMPILTGLEFLAQAKRLQPDATRILITAVLNLDTVIDAINKGEIYRFVVKPWLREELLSTVKSAVHRYELTCRNQILQASALSMNEQLTQLNASLEKQVTRVAEQNKELERLNIELKEDLKRAVQLCHRMLHTFYPILGYQAQRTHELCRAMGDYLNLGLEERQQLEASALVSNIGLVSTSREIIRRWLDKPSQLASQEQAAILHHPILGQDIMQSVHHLGVIGEIVRAHHESHDGSGYPDGLQGEQIPRLARLLTVAVAWAEAANQGPTELEVIQKGAGTSFHPEAVAAFLAVYPRVMNLRKLREVFVSDLRPGMILVKGIYTSNGALLMPEGQLLTESHIGDLQNQNQTDILNPLLLVTC